MLSNALKKGFVVMYSIKTESEDTKPQNAAKSLGNPDLSELSMEELQVLLKIGLTISDNYVSNPVVRVMDMIFFEFELLRFVIRALNSIGGITKELEHYC